MGSGPWRKLRPDALVDVQLGDGEAPVRAFVEIDLGTMDQGRLLTKVTRIASYERHAPWAERHGHMPGLLLLTTSDARARTFLQRAEKPLELKSRFNGARRVVVAACGGVRSPFERHHEPDLANRRRHRARHIARSVWFDIERRAEYWEAQKASRTRRAGGQFRDGIAAYFRFFQRLLSRRETRRSHRQGLDVCGQERHQQMGLGNRTSTAGVGYRGVAGGSGQMVSGQDTGARRLTCAMEGVA